MSHSARRINYLAKALNANSYLEIGVQSGATFNQIDIKKKVAVDPKFHFNFSTFKNDQTLFYECTSDKYFLHLNKDVYFDIIFIDGLHQFEQTLRDFLNALAHTHCGSIILIDDTNPKDVFSSLPNREDCLKHRAAANKNENDKSWHGDVFKILFFLNDFCPFLNFKTINNNGNQQTLVWREEGIRREPIFNNIEMISRSTYFDLINNNYVLNLADEIQALDYCISQTKETYF